MTTHPLPPQNPSMSTPFDMAMVQLYRGELSRSDRWRTRLDTTTNWALTTGAAVVSLGIGNPSSPHVTFIVGIALVLTFLLLEARRYRYYDLWIRRVRLLEDGYFVPMLRREPADPDALRELAAAMDRPQIQLSLFSAVITRLNRAYGPIFLVLVSAWFVKLYEHPVPAQNLHEFLYRAHAGPIGGLITVLGMGAFSLTLLLLFTASLYSRAPVGELRASARGHKVALWEQLFRPYAIRTPRHQPRRPVPASPSPTGSL